MRTTLYVLIFGLLSTQALAETAPLKSSAPENAAPCSKGCINPVEAVTFASYLGSRAGVAGEFSMSVKAIGFEKDRFFLNSEQDYRDRNCLTVVIPKAVMEVFAGSTDLDAVRKHFLGKRIITRGIARQVQIDFTADGKPTGKYYYQVHLPVLDKRFLTIVPGA